MDKRISLLKDKSNITSVRIASLSTVVHDRAVGRSIDKVSRVLLTRVRIVDPSLKNVESRLK